MDAPAAQDFDDGLWEPERLSTFRWRKVAVFGTAATVFTGVGIWIVLSGSSGPRTLLAHTTPAPGGTSWEAAVPPPSVDASPSGAHSSSGTTEKAGRGVIAPATPVDPTAAVEPPADPAAEEPSATTAESPVDTLPTRVTAKDARRIHGRYARELSIAQSKMDAKAMGKLEHGLALEMSRAAFETARMEGTQVAAGLWPRPRLWVPRDSTGTTDWFVAVAHQEGVARIMDVMASTPAGWRLVGSTADVRPVPAPLPEIATDSEGYATSLPENATGLSATPRQVARAHLASLQSTRPDARFADGPWTSEAALFWRQERAQLERAGWRLSLSYRPEGAVRSLMTSDGGALVWYAARSTDLRTARRAGALVTLKGAAAVRTGNKAFSRSASVTYGRMYAAYIPPAGSNERVRVLGEWSEVLESHGT
ncbi:hypothetical protein PS9374_04914 [Planomonospora sphaerica]|uniref:DUF8094 domain-containing protein n=1 Tax=Planomonospora sphaerica TaxID=161355 RepID=A0A171DK91_9ACTN|nr:hypothetical protein [Planomonospora sphaerica]GAT69241.1 hypothetical protein PS9374_04914 [Planomonospora sphaerica]